MRRMVASGAGSDAPTTLPASRRLRPIIPLMGARISVYDRSSSACSRRACRPSRFASVWATSARARSTSRALTALVCTACSSRARSERARARFASTVRTSASAALRAATYGARSMVYSRAPRRTSLLGVKCTASSTPFTRARTSTAATAAVRPVNSWYQVTSRWTGCATVTSGGGNCGGAGGPEPQPAAASAAASSRAGR